MDILLTFLCLFLTRLCGHFCFVETQVIFFLYACYEKKSFLCESPNCLLCSLLPCYRSPHLLKPSDFMHTGKFSRHFLFSISTSITCLHAHHIILIPSSINLHLFNLFSYLGKCFFISYACY